MSTTFTFIKRGINAADNLRPTGFVNTATKGNDGNDGTPGSSLYFINYDPSNSYYKEIVQKRLESNYILSSNKCIKLVGRTYKLGDIIMAQNKNMYRIIAAQSDSKYTYDIEYIGTLVTDTNKEEATLADTFVDVELVGYDSSIKDCIVPTNRSMDFDANIYGKYQLSGWSHDQEYFSTHSYEHPVLTIIISDGQGYLKNSSGNYPSVILDDLGEKDSAYIRSVITARIYQAVYAASNSSYSRRFKNKFKYDSSSGSLICLCGKEYFYMHVWCSDWSNISFSYIDATDNVLAFYTDGPIFVDADGNRYEDLAYIDDGGDHYVTNYNYYHSTTYDKAFKKLYGLTFKPCIRLSESNTSSSLYSDYDYYLKIYLKNKKTIQCGGYSLINGVSNNFGQDSPADPAESTLNGNFTFYKTLEMKLTKLTPNGYLNSSESPAYVNRMFVSDQSADKLHPSGNNIRINYVSPKNANTISVRGSIIGIAINLNYNWGPIYYDISYYNSGLITSPYYKNVSSSYSYTSDMGIYRNSDYTTTHSFIQYSKRNDEYPCPINFRGGESAYFSGMTIPAFSADRITALSTVTGKTYGSPFINTQQTSTDYQNLVTKTKTYSSSTFDYYASNILSLNKNCCVFEPAYFLSSSSSQQTAWETAANNRNTIVADYVTTKMADFLFSSENKYEIIAVKKTASGTQKDPIMILPIDYSKLVKTQSF